VERRNATKYALQSGCVYYFFAASDKPHVLFAGHAIGAVNGAVKPLSRFSRSPRSFALAPYTYQPLIFPRKTAHTVEKAGSQARKNSRQPEFSLYCIIIVGGVPANAPAKRS
jgi:hypothetical protein